MRLSLHALRVPALALGLALTVTACGPSVAPEDRTSGVEPSGAPIELEPIDGLDGASTYSENGVTLQVPAGYEATAIPQGGVTLTEFRAEGEPRPALTLSTGGGERTTNIDVDLSARVTEAQITGEGGTDVVFAPATLEGWEYSVAVTATKDYGDEGGVQDLLAITTADSAAQVVVTATAEAPTGTLEDSAGYQMLQTMRPVPKQTAAP